MSNRQYIESETEKLLEPILAEHHFELVDVEYVKEGAEWYLRAYIDKEGGIGINDCELVSRALEPLLDEKDLVKDAYTLEVSSPGLTRPLKKEKDFVRNMGKQIEIHTYSPVNFSKEFVGTLRSFDDTQVTIEDEEGEITFERKNISLIRPYFDW